MDIQASVPLTPQAPLTETRQIKPNADVAQSSDSQIPAEASILAASPLETARIQNAQGNSRAAMSFVGDPFTEAYSQLTPVQKQQFDSLLNLNSSVPSWLAPQSGLSQSQNPFGNVNVPVFDAHTQSQLKQLLSDGTLLKQGSDKQTILTYLSTLAHDDKNPKTHGPGLVKEAIKILVPEDLQALKQQADNMSYHLNKKGESKQDGISMPGGLGEITQCPTHFTCGAAAMQVWMRLNQPAEMIRLVHDMVSKGEATTQGASQGSLKPARNSLDFHAGDKIYANELRLKTDGYEDRSDFDIILQSALMDKIAIGNLSPYDVDADSGGIFNVIDGNSGGQPLYMKREFEKITGKPFIYAHNLNVYGLGSAGRFLGNLSDRTPQTDLVNQLKNQVSAGKQVVIAYQTQQSDPMALHYVTVVGYDPKSDRFYYADTDEKKTDRAKMYTKTSAEMNEVLRVAIWPQ